MLQVIAIGNLGGAAELRSAGGKSVCGFSIACRGRKKDDPPTWVRCSLWGERGEKVAKYLEKGAKVAVSGSLTTREYNGKTYLEIDVSELDLCGGGKPSEGSSSGSSKGRLSPETGPNDSDIPFIWSETRGSLG